ncbi:MAG: 4'-phosphopantetheinyl transferase superfamily protein [Methylococcales bacterium]|nr:4'-phosphopantetheinyl transferase superfamily protein [Methylococcales bacterium]
MLTLPFNEIHLWFTFPHKVSDLHLLSRYRQLLSSDEQQRWQRFRFQQHQHQYLMTRALVRTTLSRYLDDPPENWQFSTNQYGKPSITPARDLFFNLSNTETLIVCALSRQPNIGVDVETQQHRSHPVDIAQRFFSPHEVDELLKGPISSQRQRFFQYWTLKESYIKAKGMGLSQPLEQFSFSINLDKKRLKLSFDEKLKEVSSHWDYWLLDINAQHYGAICIYNPQQTVYQLKAKGVVPLETETQFDYTLLAMSE